jgi:hypothetical protein
MPKALCMAGMAVSILIVILFLFDLVAPASIAPFRNASRMLDAVLLVCASILAYLSWATFREQV